MVIHLLTDRQGGYLRHACDGKTEQEIAEAFGTGVRNVNSGQMREPPSTRIE